MCKKKSAAWGWLCNCSVTIPWSLYQEGRSFLALKRDAACWAGTCRRGGQGKVTWGPPGWDPRWHVTRMPAVPRVWVSFSPPSLLADGGSDVQRGLGRIAGCWAGSKLERFWVLLLGV